MRRSYLVVGGDGLIGQGLVGALRNNGLPVRHTTRRLPGNAAGAIHLDLASPAGDLDVDPCVAFLCAAVTSTKACADDPQGTRKINVDNTARLAERLLRSGTRVVFLSTNAVFDGTRAYERPDAQVCPKVEYGRQKADAERMILGMGLGAAVVRLTKVVSGSTPLVSAWASALRNGRAIQPFSDLPVCPLSLGHAVEAMLAIAQAELDGVFHLSGARDITYAEFALALAQSIGADPRLIQPIPHAQSGAALSYTPVHTTLDMEESHRRVGLLPQSLAEVISSLAGQSASGKD